MAIQNHQRDLDLTLHELEDAAGAVRCLGVVVVLGGGGIPALITA